ncbi:MAG: adenylate/guanylate cyclase domain-containing protein [bacterium]
MVERFRFLPIRFKLGLIIGAIVVVVLTAFSLIILQSQEMVLMKRMTQVSNVLIRTLSETAKGDLLLRRHDQVKEIVFRLNNTNVEGLKRVAIINHEGQVVAGFDKEGETIKIENPKSLLTLRRFTALERGRRFEYFNPIISEITENNETKQVTIGVAYIGFSKRAILAPIEQARTIALVSAVTITLLAIVGINLVAKKMANQIQLLSEGARQVGSGNLGVEISVNSKDELGQLADEFNKMIQHLREKLQMQKFVSKLTVQMIKDSVRTDGSWSRAIKQDVAVLFSDVRNFSSVAEHLDPGEIVKLINIYFDIQTRIIESHSGIVDKFMGDQIMAIFQGKNMADNSLRAAVEIQRQIRLINQQRTLKNKTTLEMGIGINNGSAVMGNMGSSQRMDYTVIGDVVNVAARLCSVAKTGQIITSYEVARKVNGSYPTSRLKSISVKGRSQKIEVCEVDYDRNILT